MGGRPPWFSLEAGLVALGMLGCVAVWLTSRHGIGVSPDSVTYLTVARNLASGHGLVDPRDGALLVTFPPLYPAMLALGEIAGGGAFETARWLSAAALAVSVVATGAIVRTATGSIVAAGVAAALTLSGTAILLVHAFAWSEPPFIATSLLSSWLLLRHLRSPRRRALIAAAALAGAAWLIRYAGFGLVAAGAVALGVAGPRTGRERLSDVWRFLAVSIAPALLWAAATVVGSGSVAGRRLGWHPPGPEALGAGARALAAWVLPAAVPAAAGVTLVLGLVAVALAQSVAPGSAPDRAFAGMAGRFLLIVAGAHVAVTAITMTFLDAATVPDARILAPAFPFVVAGIAAVAHAPVAALVSSGGARRALALAIGVVLLAVPAVRAVAWVGGRREQALGFTSERWQASPLLGAVRGLPPDAVVFTTDTAVVYWITGRVPRPLPLRFDPHTLDANPDYRAELQRMGRDLQASGGAVALFDPMPPHLPSEAELRKLLGLVTAGEFADGRLLVAPD